MPLASSIHPARLGQPSHLQGKGFNHSLPLLGSIWVCSWLPVLPHSLCCLGSFPLGPGSPARVCRGADELMWDLGSNCWGQVVHPVSLGYPAWL